MSENHDTDELRSSERMFALMAELEAANDELRLARQQVEAARGREAQALNDVNKLQRRIASDLESVKAAQPTGSDWRGSAGDMMHLESGK